MRLLIIPQTRRCRPYIRLGCRMKLPTRTAMVRLFLGRWRIRLTIILLPRDRRLPRVLIPRVSPWCGILGRLGVSLVTRRGKVRRVQLRVARRRLWWRLARRRICVLLIPFLGGVLRFILRRSSTRLLRLVGLHCWIFSTPFWLGWRVLLSG